ncbi:hypothetical protein [Kitasatospora phosalacinea]|uniref:hypothetical protein n=1 Tax=Kitasatospora phosalacinea TaxID=2065 RepID=UPI000524BFFD|nr:hypothetical protein [Kitasatospora phosalacinea]
MARRKPLVGLLVAGGVVLGVVGGILALVLGTMGYLPGDSMSVAWDTPQGRANDHGNSAWLVGDTVVRSRFERALSPFLDDLVSPVRGYGGTSS